MGARAPRAARPTAFAVSSSVTARSAASCGTRAVARLGERGGGSREPLLLNPVSRSALIAGKWLAAAALACAWVFAAGVTTLIGLRVIPWHEYGLQVSSSDQDLLAVTLSMC